jgi:hypothetical protein
VSKIVIDRARMVILIIFKIEAGGTMVIIFVAFFLDARYVVFMVQSHWF